VSGLKSRSAGRVLGRNQYIGLRQNKTKKQSFTVLAPAVSTFISAEFFKLQTHIKSSLLFEDLLDGQITLVRRPGTWWKASFFDERVQSLTLRRFSMRRPGDEAAWECSNLIVAVGLQEAGDDDCCLTRWHFE
jgi:hypothetical protein